MVGIGVCDRTHCSRLVGDHGSLPVRGLRWLLGWLAVSGHGPGAVAIAIRLWLSPRVGAVFTTSGSDASKADDGQQVLDHDVRRLNGKR